jgi:DNA repair exonuclease SbcCD ATPase subunit
MDPVINNTGFFFLYRTKSMPNEEQNLKTDVALIKKDIKQIERFFSKFDTALESMSEISQKVAVQGEVLKNTVDKLQDLDERMGEHRQEDIERTNIISERLEAYRSSSREDHARLAETSAKNRAERNKEIMSELHKMNGSLEKRLTVLDDRIKMLEQWKWYIMGLGAVIVFILANIPWKDIL